MKTRKHIRGQLQKIRVLLRVLGTTGILGGDCFEHENER